MYGNHLPVTGFSGLVYAVVGLVLLLAAGVAAGFRLVFRRH